MEGDSVAVDEVKPKVEAVAEVEERKEHEVGQNGAGSAGVLDLSGDKVLSRARAVPTSGAIDSDLAPAQLTIFYGGKVCVFDGIPADKVREIMLIATAAAAVTNTSDVKNVVTDYPASSPVLTRSPSLQSTASALASSQALPYPVQRTSLCKLQAELPIARRHSLQRFFEKRRDRLVSKNPYPLQSDAKFSDSTKAENQTCFDKSYMPQEELQLKSAANFA